PRDARALRRGERARAPRRPAAAQRGRLALPHPAHAVPPPQDPRGAARHRGCGLRGGRRRPPRRAHRPPLRAPRGQERPRRPPPPGQAGPHPLPALCGLQAFPGPPRLAGLAVSPDGRRLVTTVATPDPARTRFRTALWEVDPAGVAPARRLTRGTGEAAPAF